jgi:tetratricopeptide (TPR) repeat protein
VAALGKLREIIAHRLPTSDGATPESGTWPIIRECLACLFLVILVFHIYAHSKEGPFVFDDLVNITENSHVQISSLDWDSLRRAAFESPSSTRPVANISFALNYYFNRLDPESFRLVNVLIHLANGLLLLLFLKATLQTPAFSEFRRGMNRFMPFAATAIWLVNPIHTQSVSYIVQRMNSLAAMFCMLAFLLYIYARLSKNRRRRGLLLGSGLLAFLMALGSKEIAITLPVFVFLYEWYFFQDLDQDWLKKNYLWPLGILLFWAGMALIYLDFSPAETILSSYQTRDFTLAQRVMTQPRVIIFYIFLFLFPHPSRLNLDHYFPVSLSPLDPPTTLLAMLAIIGLLATAVLCARRYRLLSFCILWFMGNLVLESSVIGLEMVFEHRTYLPSFPVTMVIVMLLYRFVKQIWLRRAVLLLFLVLGTVWTHDRNEIWADDITLWEDIAEKSPQKARSHINLGVVYGQRGQFEKAVHYLQQAVNLQPNYVHPRYNLALSLFQKGDYPEAERQARVLQKMKPVDKESLNLLVMSLNILGKSLAIQGKSDEALENFYRAVQLAPNDANSHFNLSLTLERTGQLPEAEKYATETLRIRPDYRGGRLHLQQIRQRIELHTPTKDKPFSKAIVNLH